MLILHVYKDGKGCGLGSLWQEICKFIAHGEKGFGRGLGCPTAPHAAGGRSQEPRQKPAHTQEPGACWKEGGRKLYVTSKRRVSFAPLA